MAGTTVFGTLGILGAPSSLNIGPSFFQNNIILIVNYLFILVETCKIKKKNNKTEYIINIIFLTTTTLKYLYILTRYSHYSVSSLYY